MRRPEDSGPPCWAAMSLTIVLAFSVRVSNCSLLRRLLAGPLPPFLAGTAHANRGASRRPCRTRPPPSQGNEASEVRRRVGGARTLAETTGAEPRGTGFRPGAVLRRSGRAAVVRGAAGGQDPAHHRVSGRGGDGGRARVPPDAAGGGPQVHRWPAPDRPRGRPGDVRAHLLLAGDPRPGPDGRHPHPRR